MLPEDTKARAAAKVEEQLRQTNVDNHFKPANPEDKKPVYSHALLCEAAVSWLIQTNQACCVVIFGLFDL